jgi:hypothetical protein
VLADLAESGDGWDVLPLSGHGVAGQFLLARANGSADPLSTTELIRLLRSMRARVKLAVVSACQSAAAATAETLRWLGLNDSATELEAQAATRCPVEREHAGEVGHHVDKGLGAVSRDQIVDDARTHERASADHPPPAPRAGTQSHPAWHDRVVVWRSPPPDYQQFLSAITPELLPSKQTRMPVTFRRRQDSPH